MKLTFLGTGTSQGVPVIACHCNVCRSSDERDTRLRTSALLTVDTLNVDKLISHRISDDVSTYQHINVSTKTNHCGGIQGGISNGMPIEFRVAFHPVVSIPQPVECLHEDGHLETVSIGGRHDRYHIERAAAVVEAMTALCLINYML